MYISHYKAIFKNFSIASINVQLPFKFNKDGVVSMQPEAENAGLKLKDKIVAINGRELKDDEIYFEELSKL